MQAKLNSRPEKRRPKKRSAFRQTLNAKPPMTYFRSTACYERDFYLFDTISFYARDMNLPVVVLILTVSPVPKYSGT